MHPTQKLRPRIQDLRTDMNQELNFTKLLDVIFYLLLDVIAIGSASSVSNVAEFRACV